MIKCWIDQGQNTSNRILRPEFFNKKLSREWEMVWEWGTVTDWISLKYVTTKCTVKYSRSESKRHCLGTWQILNGAWVRYTF